MKKIIAILLVAIMSFTMLVSCGNNGGNGGEGGETTPPTAESLIAAADAAFEDASCYKAIVAMVISTDNEILNETMGGEMTSTLIFNDGDYLMESPDSDGSLYARALVGNVAYRYEMDEDGVITGEKCTLNEAQKNAVRGENLVAVEEQMLVGPDDFNTITLTEENGKYTIVYSDIKEDSIAEVSDYIGMIEFDTVTVTAVVKDGKYESFDLVMSVVIDAAEIGLDIDKDITVTATIGMDFDFTAYDITLPENAASFEDVYYEDIVGNTTYYEYVEAELGTYVAVETFVQGKQSWWNDNGVGKGTIYTQDHIGGYFLYEVPLTEEEYNALEVGTHIMVYGYKAEWDGEVEIIDAEIRIIDDKKWIAPAEDATASLGTEDIEYFRDRKVSFNGMTVEASNDEGAAFLYKWNGAGSEGDDIYFKASVNGKTYTFVIESYLTGNGTDVYEAAEALKVGDVIDMEAFLYWYDTDAQPHVYSITVK